MLWEWISAGNEACANEPATITFGILQTLVRGVEYTYLKQFHMVIPMRNYRIPTQAIVVILLVLAIWLISPVMAGGDPEAAKQAWPMIESGALVIDVRSAQEFADGHLDGAINIEWTNTDGLIKAIGINKQRPVVFYCRSGNRAGKAIGHLKLGGYTNIFNATGLGALNETKP